MFMADWIVPMTPQKATPGQHAHTVMIRIPIDVSHLSFKILCLLLL
jgi:hypothetical protein